MNTSISGSRFLKILTVDEANILSALLGFPSGDHDGQLPSPVDMAVYRLLSHKCAFVQACDKVVSAGCFLLW